MCGVIVVVPLSVLAGPPPPGPLGAPASPAVVGTPAPEEPLERLPPVVVVVPMPEVPPPEPPPLVPPTLPSPPPPLWLPPLAEVPECELVAGPKPGPCPGEPPLQATTAAHATVAPPSMNHSLGRVLIVASASGMCSFSDTKLQGGASKAHV
jgi:hypothetical protein